SPVGDGWVVAEDGVKRGLRLLRVVEILHPGVDLLLAGGVPGHFAAEGILFRAPVLGALAHGGFHGVGLGGHAFALEVVEDVDEDVAFHLAELGVVGREAHHAHGGFIGLIEIPVPGMVGDESRMIAGQPVHDPVGRGHVGIVVGAVHRFGLLLSPACPRLPVLVGAVVSGGKLVGLIVEEAFADAVLFGAVLILQVPPEGLIDELLELGDFFLVWFAEFLHGESEPWAGSRLVAGAGDPDAAVLRVLLVRVAVVADGGGGAVERAV